ncbi:hypothetical protein [Actinomadura rayongensis]|uniref:hypothetical protein n=1 Tax=Actinomadura rayongensis TaxID=1429076 RepID=UPI001F1BAB2E|nr:hypothetical protein [Actinomadura rayongensis]
MPIARCRGAAARRGVVGDVGADQRGQGADADALVRRRAVLHRGWHDGDPGLGPTYVFHSPDGHELEIYWESEWYAVPPELAPALKNQAQAYPGRGVCVRRLDRVNFLAAEVEPSTGFVRDVLGGRPTEQIRLDDGTIAGRWLTFTNKSYDLVYTRDRTGSRGRLHHIAFANETREASCAPPTCS